MNYFPDDIAKIISEYLVKEEYKLVDWIKLYQVSGTASFISNPHDMAVDKSLKNMNSSPISEFWISANSNDRVVDVLLRPENINRNFYERNSNDRIVDLLFKRGITKGYSSANSNDRIVDYLLKNPDKINWDVISQNSNKKAVDFILLPENWARIDQTGLSRNSDDRIVDLLLENPELIYWEYFSSNSNPRAVEYMKDHKKDLSWAMLATNPGIFVVNKQKFQDDRNKIEMVIKKITW